MGGGTGTGSPRGTDISKFKAAYRTRNEGEFPEELTIHLRKEFDLKYGENPHQHGAVYIQENARQIAELTNIVSVRSDNKGKGGLSLTNIMDIARAMDILKFFPETAVVVMKHNIASGFAKQTGTDNLAVLYRKARDADRRSAFGGTSVPNRIVDSATCDALLELYDQGFIVDVVAAPDYDEGIVGRLESAAKNMRIARFSNLYDLPKNADHDMMGLRSFKDMPTGRVGVQDIYLTGVCRPDSVIKDPMVVDKDGARHVVARDPTGQELDDMLTAWYLNVAGARSNGVVLVRDGVSVAVGSGQVERVGAVEQAIVKAVQKAMDREGIKYDPLMGIAGYEQLKNNPLKFAVCSSDAFFPFRDSIDRLGKMGVSAVIQPFGSVRDAEVIDAANEYNIAMVATGERCFGHF